MILVDTSVWVDHFRSGDETLAGLLDGGGVLTHPFVIGELALGNLREGDLILETLSDLPHASVATDKEVLHIISRFRLAGRGVGYVDVHLLAAARLAGAAFWTRDKRLHAAAARFCMTFAPP